MTCRHAASGCNYPEAECSGACVRMKTDAKWSTVQLQPGERFKPAVGTPEPIPQPLELWVPTIAFFLGVAVGGALVMMFLAGVV